MKTLLIDGLRRKKEKKCERIQYMEETRVILMCTTLTESVPISFIKVILNDTDDDNEGIIVTISGSATRKKNSKFRVHLTNDEEFIVDENELLDPTKYKVKRPRVGGTMEERCVWNRKVKRQSKRKEAEKVYL